MSQIDAKTLDYSDAMKSYFQSVERLLVERFDRSPDQARTLVDRYFTIDVSPWERAFVMHADADQVAADLAGENDERVRSAR